jgi:hypothetical protein
MEISGMEISGTNNPVAFTSSRDCSVDDELAEERESGRRGDKMSGASTSSWLKEGTVRREEYFVFALGGGERRGNPAELEGARRVKRSYPGIRSSENGTVTGVGFDLAEFSRRK